MSTSHVLKYQIKSQTTLHLPHGTQLLTAAEQHETWQLWALVPDEDDGHRLSNFHISVVPTGFEEVEDGSTYLTTIFNGNGTVWHVFVTQS